jgi:pimeloyl-ACP methyl ester carboxylesterase
VSGRVAYDEFGLFADNASEFGIPYDGPPTVRRQSVAVDETRSLSALVWGSAPPELVFLHGGAQNAHTWDTVALALDRPLVAIDLPGHGHSDGGKNGQLDLADNAADIAVVIRALAPDASAVIGMSLGGMTTIELARQAPELVRSMVLVDITPGVTAEKAKAITDFVNGPASFPSFDDLLKRTMEHNPTRTEASLRRGILHNAEQREDGSWVWRYARHRQLGPDAEQAERPVTDRSDLWDVIAGLTVPLLLVRGMRPQSVVDDSDEAELLRRLPSARVVHVEEAGHSVQGDTPVELARIIADFVP